MDDHVISVESVSKRYLLAHRSGGEPTSFREYVSGELRAMAARLTGRRPPPREEFWALSDVSFGVRQGEVLGIVGRNGAGKSTMLKILSRITEPTKGRVRLRGRVASLLEVGTGFHPELTGRENIYLNGAILGMGRDEIRRKFDEIVAFAEIERFLDTPVKRYSSGMYVRLAFAVAAHLEPEILIVDEVLAVGDAAFQKKCLGKMGEISAGGGRTVLFVSHSMPAVAALCRRAILLRAGRVAMDDNSRDVAAAYQIEGTQADVGLGSVAELPRSGTGKARFTSLDVVALEGDRELDGAVTGCDLEFRMAVTCLADFTDANVSVTLTDSNGYRVVDVGTAIHGEFVSLKSGQVAAVSFRLREVLLRPGMYTVALCVGRGGIEDYDRVDTAATVEIGHDLSNAKHTETFPGVYQCRFIHEVRTARDSSPLVSP